MSIRYRLKFNNKKIKNALSKTKKTIKQTPKNIGRGVKYKKEDITDNIKEILNKQRKWYNVWYGEYDENGWGEKSEKILFEAGCLNLKTSWFQIQGMRMIGIYASWPEMELLGKRLKTDSQEYGCGEATRLQANMYRKSR